MKKSLLILTGPTAAGKTALSLKLAKDLNGEIVSADSVQVYKYMDIGSAKIRPEEMEGVPHHLIDIIEPTEDFDVMKFSAFAKEAIADILGRGRLPILVGGTGFYIQAVLYDIAFTEESDDGTIRKQLEISYDNDGADALFSRLMDIDPASAAIIHKNNKKRLIRALEYYELTGEPISVHNERERSRKAAYDFLYYVLTDDRTLLYRRIDRRVDAMIAEGLVDEVAGLRERGVKKGMTAMQALGYKEIDAYLDGTITLEEAVYTIKRDTRHFAKRQLTWFKREKDVRMIDRREYTSDDKIARMIEEEARKRLL
ncbi:MAG: tRNA (adenosine(37)-N6)-dimethylallyltransferase MiaA [Lachnospiraceae bacterium]|nr:tRNA (adenosine(37)-N6)-dimethylallyltransferase MiaA [Lachnospiraceae bacterium]